MANAGTSIYLELTNGGGMAQESSPTNSDKINTSTLNYASLENRPTRGSLSTIFRCSMVVPHSSPKQYHITFQVLLSNLSRRKGHASIVDSGQRGHIASQHAHDCYTIHYAEKKVQSQSGKDAQLAFYEARKVRIGAYT